MNGILIIDKPAGITSHDVVARLRRILKTKKIGHTGTLDPFATGVLVMMVGKATRLAQFLHKDEKCYEAVFRFGYETKTGDRTGKPRARLKLPRELSGQSPIKYRELSHILPKFTGEIDQIPPMYSAKKVDGEKLYKMARKGIEIERKPVKVNISKLEILEEFPAVTRPSGSFEQREDNGPRINYTPPTQDFLLSVTCSAGTYIRTLAEDIGREIGAGCHLAELRRIKAGKFGISQAVSLEELERKVSAAESGDFLISMNESVSHLPSKTLDQAELIRISNGLKVDASFDGAGVQYVRLTDEECNLVAIGIFDQKEGQIQPRMVFLP